MASARTKIRVFRQDGTPVAEYLLGEGVHSMGRDPASAIYLESDYVSGEHARLHLSATGIEIEDLNSTSGTYLDGVSVRGKLDIQVGQKIQIGDLQVDLTVEGAGEVAAGATLGAGRYTLVQELGRGAMGTVWLATDNEFNEERAIKLLAPELAGDAVTLADLKREVQKSLKLSHENIIRVHDLSNLPGELPFITMEFIRGSNMDAVRLNQPDGLMSWKHLRPVVVQLAEALDYAHRQKIVHRDLKPANMMVTEDFTLKLADFGIAATLNDSTARSSLAGTVSGTLTYMSPQQLQGEDPKASDDIYSLGATLYNLISGRPPFKSGDVRGQILNQSPTPLTQVLASAGVVSDIPNYVSSLVMACLAKEPEDRPQSGKAILEWIVTEGKSELLTKKETSFLKRGKKPATVPSIPGAATKPNKKLVIGIAVAAIVAVAAVFFPGVFGGSGGDPTKRGKEPAATKTANVNPGTLLWEFKTGSGVLASPAVGADGTVYIGSSDKKVYALDGKTGIKKWEFETGGPVNSSPAVSADGTVYVGSDDRKVYALDEKTGAEKWRFWTGAEVNSSPALGADGTVYIGSWDNKVYAINPNGTKKWEFETLGQVYSSPAIGADGTVYIGSNDKKVYALDGKTGAKKWEFATEGLVRSSPAVGADGTVYVGSMDKKVYALDGKTGIKKWEFNTGGPVISSPAIGADRTVYVGSKDHKVYALDGRSGSKKWEFETGRSVDSSPAIGTDGTFYVGSVDFKVYALNGKTGAKKWEFDTKSYVSSSPAIGDDGAVYIGIWGLKVFAFASSSKGLAKSPWPMRGQNAQHTGRVSGAKAPTSLNPPKGASNTPEAIAAMVAVIRKAAGKPTGEFTEADYSKIMALDFDGKGISDLSDLVVTLKRPKRLWRLNLIGNRISDVSDLKELKQLSYVLLSRNKISDVSPLGELKLLRVLHLWRNEISDVSDLGGLTRLTELKLGQNKISDVSALKDLRQLKTLDLDNNRISDLNALKGLKQLVNFRFNNNKITDVSALKELTQLERIWMDGNPLSVAQIKDLQRALPNCEFRHD